MRVYNIYDCDHKTYLIRLVGPDTKAMLLIESGIRMHSTTHDWPKSSTPSGFTMKLRKHLRGRRLEHVHVLGGVDRIVDLQFGSNEAAYHVIVELYDVGNIILTDCNFTILNILRRRTDKETETRFSNHLLYPVHLARQKTLTYIEPENILASLNNIQDTKLALKRALGVMDISPYGIALLQHCLTQVNVNPNDKLKQYIVSETKTAQASGDSTFVRTYQPDFLDKLRQALLLGEELMQTLCQKIAKGYIIMAESPVEHSAKSNNPESAGVGSSPKFDEYHPILFAHLQNKPHEEFDSFLAAVDTYYSNVEAQRLSSKIAVQERQATDKLQAVRRDHEARLHGLRTVQERGVRRADLLALNRTLVDEIIDFLNNLIAVGMSWTQIDEFIAIEQAEADPVACRILRLDLERNAAIIVLNDPYATTTPETADAGDDADAEEATNAAAAGDDEWADVEIDLHLNAFQNMEKLHNEKRTALKKEEKTLQSSEMALKNAERKAFEAMKTVVKIQNIYKTRKTFWFEKFQWMLSSDGVLVIAGRDRQQNELIVKRHLADRDIYMHAELHGASSVVIKNIFPTPITTAAAAAAMPLDVSQQRSLREAGIFAACLSHAWNDNIATRVWWVYSYQVSKTAPTGEYLPTGSFMIRGKKNFLPVEPLVMGFGFLFKLDDVSAERRLNLRKREQEKDNAEQIGNKITVAADDGEEADDRNDVSEFPDIPLNTTLTSARQQQNNTTNNKTTLDEEENIDSTFDIVDKTTTTNAGPPPAAIKKSGVSGKVPNGVKNQKQAPAVAATTAEPASAPAASTSSSKLERSGKNKKRMQRKKYAQQDEEERVLRTKLYKSREEARELLLAKKLSNNPAGSKIAPEKDTEVEGDAVEIDQKVEAEKEEEAVADDHEAATDGVDVGALHTDLVDLGEDNFEDNLIELNEDNFVSGVCSDPTAEDSLMWAIPVCSPYATLTSGKYKYRLKLIPAAAQANAAYTKRSKIVKSAIAVMTTQQKDAIDGEKELIKAVKDQELYKTIIGNCKIGLAAQVLKKANTKNKNNKKAVQKKVSVTEIAE